MNGGAGEARSYLKPYLRAAKEHGDGFGALLWASPRTQALRFDALLGLCPFKGRNVLDVGCGRADLLDYLVRRLQAPAHYTGIEAVPALAASARAKGHEDAIIVEADFVREPGRMLVGADVIVFCGSLNTLDEADFYRTLTVAYGAATTSLAFNFLSSSRLAAAEWLTWHAPQRVLNFCKALGGVVESTAGYLDGDHTVVVHKSE